MTDQLEAARAVEEAIAPRVHRGTSLALIPDQGGFTVCGLAINVVEVYDPEGALCPVCFPEEPEPDPLDFLASLSPVPTMVKGVHRPYSPSLAGRNFVLTNKGFEPLPVVLGPDGKPAIANPSRAHLAILNSDGNPAR